jgi:hypothetical protein
MRRPAWIVPFLLLLPGLGAAAPRPAGPDLTLVNRSGQPINEVYVSSSQSTTWGEDRLGERTLPPGRAAHVGLGHVPGCTFDVLVVYDDASREERDRVDLCRHRELTFDGRHATAAPRGPTAHGVTIVNHAPLPIQQVLISPSAAEDWGEDLLAHRTLSVGEAATVPYRGDCIADLRVVFANRSAEERRDIDLCSAPTVVIAPGWTTSDLASPKPGATTMLLTVSNRSGRPIVALYVFPEGSTAQGPELLSSGGLDAGAQIAVTLARPAGVCRFAARVVFADAARPLDLPAVDLCTGHELIISASA